MREVCPRVERWWIGSNIDDRHDKQIRAPRQVEKNIVDLGGGSRGIAETPANDDDDDRDEQKMPVLIAAAIVTSRTGSASNKDRARTSASTPRDDGGFRPMAGYQCNGNSPAGERPIGTITTMLAAECP